MITVAPFVETYLKLEGYLGNCRTLFIAENYPNLSTYFYRTLVPNLAVGANPFFNNLTNALGIPLNPERKRLDDFLNNGFRLIDAFDTVKKMHPIADIYDDILSLSPKNIVFISNANEYTIKTLTRFVSGIQIHKLPTIVPDFYKAKMVHCFPNPKYPSHVRDFNQSIKLGIQLGIV